MDNLLLIVDIDSRLDIFLTKSISVAGDSAAKTSRNYVQKLIESGYISVNDVQCLKCSFSLSLGDKIEVRFPENKSSSFKVDAKVNLNIIYEDDHIIVINKQAGLVVHPAHGNEHGTLLHGLTSHCIIEPEVDIDVDFEENNDKISMPALVHRLDKDTTGVMIAAKSMIAYKNLIGQFANKTAQRNYYAFVWGYVESGTISTYIGRSPSDRKKMAVMKRPGKIAITHYAAKKHFKISNDKYISLVECSLETGKTHQIRVHMKHIGHPVIGDCSYFSAISVNYNEYLIKSGVNINEVMPRQALHSHSLKLTHPVSGKILLFEAKIPDDMKRLYDLCNGVYPFK